MKELAALKTEQDDFQVEYEIVTPISIIDVRDNDQEVIQNNIYSIDELIAENQKIIDAYSAEIDRLTDDSDNLDYIVSVACGVATGALDAIFVGDIDFNKSLDKVNLRFRDVFSKQAKRIKERECKKKIEEALDQAKSNAGELNAAMENEIADMIKKQLGMGANNEWELAEIGTDLYVRQMNDMAHHPSVAGWAAAIVAQLSGDIKNGLMMDGGDKHNIAKVSVIENINALIRWDAAENVSKHLDNADFSSLLKVAFVGDNLETQLACGTINWILNMVFDFAQAKESLYLNATGMALPEPIVTTIKGLAEIWLDIKATEPISTIIDEISTIMSKSKSSEEASDELSQFIKGASKKYAKVLGKELDLPGLFKDIFTREGFFDGKTHIDWASVLTVGQGFGKQAIPVMLNEILVRSFYFLRHFIEEYKTSKSIKNINWKNTIPFRNRSITRMLTIATGAFEAIDLGDAAIRGALKSGGTLPGFFSQFVLRVNFVGVGRFAIACGTDTMMESHLERKENERIEAYNKMLYLMNAKIYYRQENLWIAAGSAIEATDELCKYIEREIPGLIESNANIADSMNNFGSGAANMAKANPEWAEKMRRRLRR